MCLQITECYKKQADVVSLESIIYISSKLYKIYLLNKRGNLNVDLTWRKIAKERLKVFLEVVSSDCFFDAKEM